MNIVKWTRVAYPMTATFNEQTTLVFNSYLSPNACIKNYPSTNSLYKKRNRAEWYKMRFWFIIWFDMIVDIKAASFSINHGRLHRIYNLTLPASIILYRYVDLLSSDYRLWWRDVENFDNITAAHISVWISEYQLYIQLHNP